MLKQKNKHNISKNKIASLILIMFLTFTFSLTPTKKSQAWLTFAGVDYQIAREELIATIKSITLANLKQAAYSMILQEIDKMVTDMTNIGTAFITDWEDYLINTPERESAAFMNDLLSNVDQGRSSSRYRSVSVAVTLSYANVYEGFGAQSEYQFALIKSAQAQEESDLGEMNEEIDNNYASAIKQMGEAAIETRQKNYMPQPTCTDDMRSDMFGDETLNNFWECTGGPNNAVLENAMIQAKYAEILASEKEKAKIKQEGGVIGAQDGNNNTTVPATTMAAIINKSRTMGMDIIVKAESIPELVTAAVINAVNRSIQQGIGSIKARLQNEMAKARGKLTNQMRKAASEYGPAATFNSR